MDVDAVDVFCSFLYAVERQSEHPIAKAVTRHVQSLLDGRGLLGTASRYQVRCFEARPGYGVSGVVDFLDGSGRRRSGTVTIGSLEWMEVQRVTGLREQLAQLAPLDSVACREGQGQLTVYTGLALDGEQGRLIGVAYLTDVVKPDADDVLSELRRRGYDVYMLTGDAATTARSVGAQLGFDDDEDRVRARMKPEDKADVVRELQLGGRRVAMVGDGVNDSLAMAQADVSVSFAAGTDLARSTADVVLLKDQLTDLCAALSIARETMRTIRVNIAWAIVYNIVAMPVAAGFLYPLFGIAIPPAVAGFAEFFSSIPVILYSLWLRRFKPASLP